MYKIHVEKEIAVMHQLKNHKGKCRHPHGHNLFVEVDVEGEQIISGGSSDGMLVDFGDIKSFIDKFDHTDLNASLGMYVDVCKTHPTAERFAKFLAENISIMATGKCIVTVKVHEAKGQWAQYTEK